MGAKAAKLRDRLLDAATAEAKFSVLEQTLLARTTRLPGRHPAVAFALGRFESVPQRLKVSDVARWSGLTLEKKWLAFIEDHGYRLPSHAQRLFAEAGTRPDFFYDGDYGAAIYIDGPHHDYPERQNRDAAKTEAMEDLGYMVIRFGHQDDWNEMINQYPYISGARYESRRTPRYTTPVRNCE